MTNPLIEDVQEDFFSRAADAMITKRKMPRPPPPAPKAPSEPRPLATKIAEAYRNGFEAAAEISGQRCGCNVSGVNPHDGSAL